MKIIKLLKFVILLIVCFSSNSTISAFSLSCNNLSDISNECTNYQEGEYGSSTDTDNNNNFSDSEYVNLDGDLLAKYNANFGSPSCEDTDNPIITLTIEQQYQLITANCAINIRRRYRVSDGMGNISSWTIQNIAFSYAQDWVLIFNPDIIGTCGDELNTNGIEIINGGCDLWELEAFEELKTVNGCPRLEKTYHLKNFCLYDGTQEPQELPRFEDEDGISTEFFFVTHQGNENISYLIYKQVALIDDDCIKPSISLLNNLKFNMLSEGTIEIQSYSLIQSNTDNCTAQQELKHRIWHNSLGNQPTDLNDIYDLPEYISFDCDDLGDQTVTVFVFDEAGNYEMETTSIEIQGVTNCSCEINNLNISDNPLADGEYRGLNTISSTAKILNNGNVSFFAGNSITLFSGFHVESGSTFNASIATCSNNLNEDNNSVLPRNNHLQITKSQKVISLLIYPNPFKLETTIQFELKKPTNISISVFDINGKLLRELQKNTILSKGVHMEKLVAQNLLDGIYFVQIIADNQVQMKKVLIAR